MAVLHAARVVAAAISGGTSNGSKRVQPFVNGDRSVWVRPALHSENLVSQVAVVDRSQPLLTQAGGGMQEGNRRCAAHPQHGNDGGWGAPTARVR
jgi:hypothetical protein